MHSREISNKGGKLKDCVIDDRRIDLQGAISNKFSKRNAGPTKHWLEHYLDTHNCENDPKCMALKGTKKKTQHLCQKVQ